MASDKLGAFRFAIEGHADPRGDAADNLKLSQARAESVRDYLVAEKQIDQGRLEPIGKGDQDLINKVNRIAPENRRVTIVNISK
jgi:outer membrane protein OmpA-like peptidoglycan-associated protein